MGCAECSINQCLRYTWEQLNIEERPLMVIGESPTALEVRKGLKMTGSGAKVLKETMAKVGLPTSEDEVYFTTALKCAAPKGKGRKIPKDASDNCHSILLKEIAQVKPRVLLVCGAMALQTLLGASAKIKITAEYGRVREYDFLPGVQVIPIMNPGALLHKPGDYKPFLTMIQLAATIYSGNSVVDTGETTWEVMDTVEKCKELWNTMMSRYNEDPDFIAAYDIETTGLDYRVVDFCVLGICFDKNKAYVIPREMQQQVHNFIAGVPWRCLWQGGKYDKKVMWRRGLGNISIDEDTMYQHYVLDETSEHNLGYLSKVYLNAAEYKYKMNQNWAAVSLETYGQFFEALCERVSVDVDYTLQLYNKFNDLLQKEPKLQEVYKELIIPAANFLSRVEENGMLVNEKYLEALDVKYKQLLERILIEVEEAAAPFWDSETYMFDTQAKSAPLCFNPGSPKQMSWMIFQRLKLKPRIKKGTSTSKEVLRSIENPPALVKKVLEFRSVQKEHSTYVLGILNARDTDGRVRSTFSLHITATGRLSSKEPNVQNLPSANGVGDIRKAFVARPGYVLAEIDYAGAELRWLAVLSKCPVLSEVFRSDRNLHTETAKSLFGEHFSKAEKLRAKAMNFGIAYGRSAKSIAEEHNMPLVDAEKMVNDWLNLYHGAADYLHGCDAQVTQGAYMSSAFGRRRRFGLVSPATLSSLQNEARNFGIQSASSDTTLVCAMNMEETLLQLYDTRIINLVHDSILLEIPADEKTVASVGAHCSVVMEAFPRARFGIDIPFKTDYEIGKNWCELVTFDHKGYFEKKSPDKIIEWENKDGSMGYSTFESWYNGGI
ncbi:MAG: DNA polymerase [Eubacteriales bacterium]